MPSPFATFTNSLLTFKVPTGVVTLSPQGNRVIETSLVVLEAALKPVKDSATINHYIGDDDSAEVMSGYLVEPTTLPILLKPPCEGAITITTAVGRSEAGTFKLMPRSQSSTLVGLKIDYLTKIIGVFRRG